MREYAWLDELDGLAVAADTTNRKNEAYTREQTHPQNHQREETCTHFATRILREREMAEKQQINI